VKFRIERDVLADAVAWAARSLPTRPSVPVLAGLLVEATAEGLVLSGFDYETSARATLPAEVSDEGRALVSGRLLADICRSLPARPVDVSMQGTKVSLVCGTARFSLQTMPVEDYPTLPDMPTSTGSVQADVFAAAVAQAVAAAGRDDMLPLLTGVRIEIEGDTVALMATDRFRASLRELTWHPEQSDVSTQALVPARVLGDMAKSLTQGTQVTVALAATGSGDGIIGFEGVVGDGSRRRRRGCSKASSPRTPALRRRAADQGLGGDRCLDRVGQAGVLGRRTEHARTADLLRGTGRLEAGSGDDAQATESVEAQVDGDDISIGFNPQYLLDGLGVVHRPWTHLAFVQHTRPASMSGAEESGAEPELDFRYLLMPVRLQS
jgi:DNA polymerase-3 subunit beta